MTSAYAEYIEQDPRLHESIKDSLPAIQLLSALQIEKLVFYLKSLHAYYPRSENHIVFYDEFSARLDKMRNSDEQRALQHKAMKAGVLGVGICVLAGVAFSVAVALLLAHEKAAAIILGVVGVAMVLFADAHFLRETVLLGKEQDRKFFLASIRAARACNELDWAGLFAYHKASKDGPNSDEDTERVHKAIGELAASLRAALYNDEHFQYSDPRLSELATGDA